MENRWLDFEYDLKVKPAGFSGELDVGCERSRVKDYPRVFGLNN